MSNRTDTGIEDHALDTGAVVPAESRSTELRRGALDMAPLLVGYAPFAMIVGTAIAEHTDPAAGWAGIWLVLGGSAHLATLRALADGPAVLAAATGLLVNARLVVYSASLRPIWGRQPVWFRLVAAALLIDPTWAAAHSRAARSGTDRAHRNYYLASAVVLSTGWCLMITAGMVVGSAWSAELGLEVAVPLCLIVLVAPRLLDRSTRGTVAVAAVLAVVTNGAPGGVGTLLVIVAGGALGALRS